MNIKREKVIINTSIIGVICNILLSVFKGIVGFASSSIAIISDAINNLSDAFSSIITIIGTKIASKSADKEHPYGHGRIEYMASFIISSIIIYVGISTFVESIKKVINPSKLEYKLSTFIVVFVAIIVKFILSLYVKRKASKVNSTSLYASAADAFNDAIISISVFMSLIIFTLFRINIEPYVGAFVSIYIIYSGIKLIKESFDKILGFKIKGSLLKKIKNEIMKEKEVKGVFDLMLHDYGPDNYIGSVCIEVNDTLVVSKLDNISRRIKSNIKKKYGVMLNTIGVYSVNTKDKEISKIQNDINKIVFSYKSILEIHGFYVDKKLKEISFDIIINNNKNKENICKEIYDKIKEKYSEYEINIMVDIDTSD